MANTFFLSSRPGEGLFASSPLPSFVFSAAQRKISYSNHMRNFFIQFFSTAPACILSCTHFVDKANGSSFFSSLLWLSEVGGVCSIFRQFPLLFISCRERKISFEWIMDCGQIFFYLFWLIHPPPHNWGLFVSQWCSIRLNYGSFVWFEYTQDAAKDDFQVNLQAFRSTFDKSHVLGREVKEETKNSNQ